MAVYDGGHALIVGVGADLPNTTRDAKGVSDILKDPSRCAYPPEHVNLLTSEGATRDAVLSALDTLAQTSSPESAAIVFFSGHGYRVTSPTGEFYYLLPYGYDLRRLDQTAIGGAEFTARLRAIPAKKLLVLLDCCHAGGVGEETEAPGLDLAKSPMPSEARDLLAEGSSKLVLIASSRSDELSFAGRPYSAFTLALIEALSGTGAARQDGYVRVADLALHARQVVPGRTRDRQHPVLHFEQADNFVLAYYAGGETQAKGVPFAGEPEIEPEPGAWTALDQRGQTVHGPQVNVAGTFEGPVTVTQSEEVDLRGAQGAIYKPTGTVQQELGPHVEIDGEVSGQVGMGDGQTMIQIRDASAGGARAQAPSPKPSQRFCTSCGRRLRPGAKFCSGCGKPVEGS